jgi:hypothetical protein
LKNTNKLRITLLWYKYRNNVFGFPLVPCTRTSETVVTLLSRAKVLLATIFQMMFTTDTLNSSASMYSLAHVCTV